MSTTQLKRPGFDAGKIVWAACILLTVYFVLLPMAYLVIRAFFVDGTPSLSLFVEYLFADPRAMRAGLNSLIFGVSVAAVSVLVGVPLAFGVSRTDMAWKELVRITVLIAIITPPFLRTMAYILLFGPNAGQLNVLLRWAFFPEMASGPLNVYTIPGLILLSTPIGIAQVFILTSTALSQMDPALEEAARTSGASRARTVWTVSLPVCRNAIFAGALMAFAIALSLYGTPHLLGIDVLTTQIREALLMPINFEAAAVLSTGITALGLMALVAYRQVTREANRYQTVSGKGFRPAVMRLGGYRHLFTGLGILYGLLSFVLPYGALIVISFFPTLGRLPSFSELTFSHYVYVFTSDASLRAIWNSLILATATAFISIILSTVIGYIVVRSRSRFRGLLDYLAIAPLALSGIAIAVGLVLVYTSQPFVRLHLYGTSWLLLFAYIALQLPIALRAIQTSLMQIGPELEEAARVSGATWAGSMRMVILPLIKQGLSYAWVLVFLGVIPELSASIMLRQLGNDTVATMLLDLWGGAGGFQRASALGTAVFLLVATVFFVTRWLTRRDAFGTVKS
ncbi:ABC transporter permease [Martelella radicis]|uniref:Iron(III) transport system permease protein n=1 Tax=Martelella radicis TaxID=1397476 RepID=A0A7W6KP18_9HYPH|nr:iron ABC transporter permease [Martelella radicis]MBB4124695.1 iron(III) transport system permease protein [Martelella radicis]